MAVFSFVLYRDGTCNNKLANELDLSPLSRVFGGVCMWGGQVKRLEVVLPDSLFIPYLNYKEILPEFKEFLPVKRKCCVMVDLKVIALIDYQTPLCTAIFPFLGEWYERQKLRGLYD